MFCERGAAARVKSSHVKIDTSWGSATPAEREAQDRRGRHSSFFAASPHEHVDRVEFTNFRDALLARRDRIRKYVRRVREITVV